MHVLKAGGLKKTIKSYLIIRSENNFLTYNANNFCHFEFFYRTILLPFKNCPINVLYKFS